MAKLGWCICVLLLGACAVDTAALEAQQRTALGLQSHYKPQEVFVPLPWVAGSVPAAP